MKKRLGSGVKAIGGWFRRGWESKWAMAARERLRREWFTIGLGVFFVLVGGYGAYKGWHWLYRQDGAGFKGKTLWDVLGLVGVPAILAIGAYAVDQRGKRREEETRRIEKAREEEAAEEREKTQAETNRLEKEREEIRLQEEILQDYLDDMSQLLLHERLKETLAADNAIMQASTLANAKNQGIKPLMDTTSPVVDVAQARTVTTLRRLKTTERRKELLDFLRDVGLYSGETALLRGAKMDGIDLNGTDLGAIDLGRASLRGASLRGANLQGAKMEWARLDHANLSSTDLVWAHLTGAVLAGANLQQARMEWARLERAVLVETDLRGANLGRAVLQDAALTWRGNGSAKFDDKTILPNGEKWHEGANRTQWADWMEWTGPKKDVEG